MKPRPKERGQALIIIALAAVGLFAFAALAVDGSRVFSDRRHAQNAADTAVLAAALAKVRGQDYSAAAVNRADSNGFNATNSSVEVHLCSDANLDPPCEALPAGANAGEYIQVVIRTSTKTTFARIVGRTEVPTVVTAVARASGSTFNSTFSGKAAMLSTKSGNFDQCFLMNGGNNLNLHTHGSGVYVNCSGPLALYGNGSAYLQMDEPGNIVGCYGGSPAFQFSPSNCNNGAAGINASTFASVPTTQPPPACPGPAPAPVNNVYSPGTYSDLNINAGVTATMNPGVYCINGGLNISAGAALSAPNGRVQIVLQDQNIVLTGGATMDFSDLEIYGRNASFTLIGGGVIRADRLRYFSTGAGSMNVQGGSELTSGNAYFYMDQGNLNWNGNPMLNLHGPPQGDPFGGLLLHKPWDNTTPVLLNGDSNIHLTGTFMVPGSPVTLNGNVNYELHSQLIGSTFTVSGSSTVDIYYLPEENYTPPASPFIQLTK